MKIAIIAPYVSLPYEPKSNRFKTLAEMLSRYTDVILVTSKFDHASKSMRKSRESTTYEVKLIWEAGYRSNTSIKRVFSHFCFLVGLAWWLSTKGKSINKFICAVPFSTSALLCKLICPGKLIIDVQDVWPESFAAISMPKLFSDLVKSSAVISKSAIERADLVITVSKEFSKRCEILSLREDIKTVYIGSEVKEASRRKVGVDLEGSKNIRLAYIGTIGKSYDLELFAQCVIDADCKKGIEFFIIGDGPEKIKLQKKFSLFSNIVFMDYMQFDSMALFLNTCHFAVNPIIGKSAATVTNKVSDYFAIGIPFISGQNSTEVQKLVEEVSPFLCYEPGSASSIDNVLSRLGGLSNSEYWNIEIAAQSIGEKLFLRSVIYQRYIELVINC